MYQDREPTQCIKIGYSEPTRAEIREGTRELSGVT